MQADDESPRLVLVKTGLGEGEHKDAFTRAVTNILTTEIAELTYAQIVDGLPLAEVVQDTGGEKLPGKHPIHRAHTSLCSGVLDKTHQLRQDLDLGELQFQSKLLSEYRSAAPGSRMFNVRLIEMAAVGIHQIAVQLYNLDTSLHRDDDIASWTPPKDHIWWRFHQGAWPTLFQHDWYENHEYYPNGVADMVGYWAEARIFGGVVLFDRREPESGPDVQPESVWFHPNRSNVTYRITRLSDVQKQALLGFLTSESPDLELLPILPDENDTVREDPEEPVENTGIYRDPWERKRWEEYMGDSRLRDVWDQFDYPTWSDFERSRDRADRRRDGFYE